MSAPGVSIVMPTRNGAATLPAVLDAIGRQQIDGPIEVIAVDSGSTDGSVDLLTARVDRVIAIAPDAFDHGATRNVGVEAAGADLVVLLVQDAVPANERWLASLVAPLAADAAVAGTFARQIPRTDASPIARHYLASWIGASEAPRTVKIASEAAFDALSPSERLRCCTFDNVCSCIRRSVWQRHPFRPTAIAEDVEWAREVLLAGHTLAYVPDAVVVHSHDRSARYEFMRTFLLHRRLFELFGLRTVPTLPSLARAVASSAGVHLRRDRSARALALAVAWPLGQYLGGLSAVRGWAPVRSRMV
jgi:glycosyltransferase involved in cell wall biosynthesis